MMAHAPAVYALTVMHDNLHSTRWRQVQVVTDMSPAALKALLALDELEADIVRQQRAAARPVVRRYEVVAN